MPRYSLRTLLLVALIAGPLLAWGWGYVESVIEERREAERAAAAAKWAEESIQLIGSCSKFGVLYEIVCFHCGDVSYSHQRIPICQHCGHSVAP